MRTTPDATARHVTLSAALLAVIVLLATACGGPNAPGVAGGSPSASKPPSAGGSSGPPESKLGSLLAYARCMRTHGVEDYPDPKPTGHGGYGIPIDGTGDLSPSNPTYAAANHACASLLPGGEAHQLAQQAQLRTKALRYADCMRSHGITDFPDPDAHGQFPEAHMRDLGKGSQQFTAAQNACQHYLNSR